MYDISKLYEAKSLYDALGLLKKHPAARVIAGGTDLLVKIREGKLSGIECVSIHKLDELRGVSVDRNGTIEIRPLTSFSHIAADSTINKYIPVLAEAVSLVGGPQIRNMGTIGGNVCNGATSADSASTLFAYGAELELTGSGGRRTLPISEFYLGPGKVALEPSELLTMIRIKRDSYKDYHGKYMKYSMRRAMDIATLGCCVICKLSEDKKFYTDVRIAYGVAAATPMRCDKAEACVMEQLTTTEAVGRFVDMALTEITPRSSWRASKELRMQVAAELARRALTEATVRAGGEIYG